MRKQLNRSDAYRLIEEWGGKYGILTEQLRTVYNQDIETEDVSIMTDHLAHIYTQIDELCSFVLDKNDIPLFEEMAKLLNLISHIKERIQEGYSKFWDSDKIDFTQWQKLVFCYIETPIYDVGNKLIKYNPNIESEIRKCMGQSIIEQPQSMTIIQSYTETKEPQKANEDMKDLLKSYFIFPFWGKPIKDDEQGRTKFDLLIEDLQKPMTAKDLAAELLAVFNSPKVNKDKRPTFAKWLSLWSDFLGNKSITNYKPNQLDPSRAEKVLYYLQL